MYVQGVQKLWPKTFVDILKIKSIIGRYMLTPIAIRKNVLSKYFWNYKNLKIFKCFAIFGYTVRKIKIAHFSFVIDYYFLNFSYKI